MGNVKTFLSHTPHLPYLHTDEKNNTKLTYHRDYPTHTIEYLYLMSNEGSNGLLYSY
jgi:hypothetical protein